jgi:hypothetical protein
MSGFAEAKALNKLAEVMHYYLDLRSRFRDSITMAAVMNTAFIKIWWDWGAGKLEKGVRQGDVAVSIVNPERVVVDPCALCVTPEQTPGCARWLVEMDTMSVMELTAFSKRMSRNGKPYGELQIGDTLAGGKVIYGGIPDVNDLKRTNSSIPTPEETGMMQGVRVMGTLNADADKISGLMSEYGGRVKIYRRWEMPSDQFPAGRFCWYLPDNNNHIIEYREELPNATTEHPEGLFGWASMVDIPVPGRMAGNSRMSMARAAQDQINYDRTAIREIMQRFQPVLMADIDSGFNLDEIEKTDLATIMKYHSRAGGQKPEMFWPPAIAAYVEMLQNDIRDLTAFCETVMDAHNVANYPKANPTAYEVSLAKGEDVAHWTDDAKRYESTYRAVMKQVLRLVQRNYPDERVVEYLSGQQRAVSYTVKRRDVSVKDVMIVPGSSMPRNKRLMQMNYMAAAQAGLFQSRDPQEQDRLNREGRAILNLDISSENTHEQANRNRALAENEEMLDGQVVDIAPWEDNIVHMEIHYLGLLSPDFYNIKDPSLRKEVENIFRQHIGIHNDAERQAAQNAGISPQARYAMAMPEGQQTQMPQAAPQAQLPAGITGPEQEAIAPNEVAPSGQ